MRMEIEWENINNKHWQIVESWLSNEDKQNLCLTQKSWQQTAKDINECLNLMQNSQFKNIIGYVNGKPAVAIMFGIESIGVLNLYNIVINPKLRNMGIGKEVLLKLLNKDKCLNLNKPFNKVCASVLKENFCMQNALKSLNFNCLGFNGEYVVFEKQVCLNKENLSF